MSLGEIYETECRGKKRPLGPVGTGKMRRKPVRSKCDVLEAKELGGMITVETKIIYSWLGIKQNSIFCIWTWVSTYTYILCMNPSPSRHQWPYENLYECWWTFPLETHIQIHAGLKTTMEAPGAGKVHPRSQVHKYPLAIPKEVFSWYEPNRLNVEVQKLQVSQLFQVCFHMLEWVNLSGLLGGTQNMSGLAQVSEQAWKQMRTHHHLLHVKHLCPTRW